MPTKTAGVRVPDLVWIPKVQVGEAVAKDPMRLVPPLALVPPLVVEVLSEHDRWPVLAHKARSYLETGVRGVAVVRLDGAIAYDRADGVHAESVSGLRVSP